MDDAVNFITGMGIVILLAVSGFMAGAYYVKAEARAHNSLIYSDAHHQWQWFDPKEGSYRP